MAVTLAVIYFLIEFLELSFFNVSITYVRQKKSQKPIYIQFLQIFLNKYIVLSE